jgi:flagellar basal-body rod protein FlgC
MNLFSIFDISSAGMSVEQSKLAVTASNIANSRTSKMSDGTVFKPLAVSVRSVTNSYQLAAATVNGVDVGALPRPEVAGVVASDTPPRMVYDPGHPDADERGFVSLPAVDPVSSMLELMSISRSYEANIRAFDITRSLIQRTIDMGNKR